MIASFAKIPTVATNVNQWLQRFLIYGKVFFMKSDGLKQWRERLGLSQEQLAKALAVARNTVSRWESGSRAIPPYLELALKQLEADKGKEI